MTGAVWFSGYCFLLLIGFTLLAEVLLAKEEQQL